MTSRWAALVAHAHFEEARRKALLTALLDVVRGRSNSLLSFDEVRVRLNVRGQRSLGHKIVPLDHIIGSEGRYSDFDRHFLPRSDALQQRWSTIDQAMLQAVDL